LRSSLLSGSTMVIREIDVDWLDSGADFPGLETWTPALHRAGSVKG